MKEFIIHASDEGRKLEKWLIREMPTVGMGMRQKLFRNKCFKLNGKHVKGDAKLAKGDVLQIYASDDLFLKPKKEDPKSAGNRLRQARKEAGFFMPDVYSAQSAWDRAVPAGGW